MTQTENCTLCEQPICGKSIHLAEFGGVTYCYGCAQAAVRAYHLGVEVGKQLSYMSGGLDLLELLNRVQP
jgi:hypothetical protein